MVDEEHSESEFYYLTSDNFRRTANDQVGAGHGQDEGDSQTAVNRPYSKLLINLDHSDFTGESQTSALPY